ncbi:MAG: hypothetical protein P8Y42_18845 [Exilibacterium sp.]
MKNLTFALAILSSLIGKNALAFTQCNEVIVKYFIGTTTVNQEDAHLWVGFQGGGSASVSSKSGAYEGMLATTLTALVTKSPVRIRYYADDVECNVHHSDWVGLWIIGQ